MDIAINTNIDDLYSKKEDLVIVDKNKEILSKTWLLSEQFNGLVENIHIIENSTDKEIKREMLENSNGAVYNNQLFTQKTFNLSFNIKVLSDSEASNVVQNVFRTFNNFNEFLLRIGYDSDSKNVKEFYDVNQKSTKDDEKISWSNKVYKVIIENVEYPDVKIRGEYVLLKFNIGIVTSESPFAYSNNVFKNTLKISKDSDKKITDIEREYFINDDNLNVTSKRNLNNDEYFNLNSIENFADENSITNKLFLKDKDEIVLNENLDNVELFYNFSDKLCSPLILEKSLTNGVGFISHFFDYFLIMFKYNFDKDKSKNNTMYYKMVEFHSDGENQLELIDKDYKHSLNKITFDKLEGNWEDELRNEFKEYLHYSNYKIGGSTIYTQAMLMFYGSETDNSIKADKLCTITAQFFDGWFENQIVYRDVYI